MEDGDGLLLLARLWCRCKWQHLQLHLGYALLTSLLDQGFVNHEYVNLFIFYFRAISASLVSAIPSIFAFVSFLFCPISTALSKVSLLLLYNIHILFFFLSTMEHVQWRWLEPCLPQWHLLSTISTVSLSSSQCLMVWGLD